MKKVSAQSRVQKNTGSSPAEGACPRTNSAPRLRPRKPKKHRLDHELVRQGFFPSAQAALPSILAGDVSNRHSRLTHPGDLVEEGEYLHVKSALPFVGRGALKLEQALSSFSISAQGLNCLDVGCSTGGFTDCLLKRGAARVVSVDVGYAQFSWSLRNDPRVVLFERTNICALPACYEGPLFDLVVSDVSFTSIETILPAVYELMDTHSLLVTLVKPQFEVDAEEVSQGGIVRSWQLHKKACLRAQNACISSGLVPLALCPSPIRGHKGNQEFLLVAAKGVSPSSATLDVDSVCRDLASSSLINGASQWVLENK